MNCVRCKGCVVTEQLSDPQGTSERLEALRCLNCGNVEDALIEANRNRHMGRLSSRMPRLPIAGWSLDRGVDSARETSSES